MKRNHCQGRMRPTGDQEVREKPKKPKGSEKGVFSQASRNFNMKTDKCSLILATNNSPGTLPKAVSVETNGGEVRCEGSEDWREGKKYSGGPGETVPSRQAHIFEHFISRCWSCLEKVMGSGVAATLLEEVWGLVLSVYTFLLLPFFLFCFLCMDENVTNSFLVLPHTSLS